MGGQPDILRWFEQGLGILLILLVLLDVFLTVLYARMGTGIFSNKLAYLTWHFFRWLAKFFGRRRGSILSFCGPVILVLLILVWSSLLAVGAALVMQPALGFAIRASSGDTPTDFITALFVGGSSMSIVGASDFSPHTNAYRLFFLFTSLVGLSVTSLTLSYLMQVYSALHRRNTLGLKVHLLSAETGDAANILAGLGPEGQFSGGYTNLSDIAAEMTQAKESHHFYPVLFFFRFQDSFYSVSRFTLTALDTVSLIKSALDDEKYAWLKESAAVTQLWRAALLLVKTLETTFLPGGLPERPDALAAPTLDRWRHRYFAALERLRQAGIPTIADEQAGAQIYLSLRTSWDTDITDLASSMAYQQDEIDPIGHNSPSAAKRPEFRERRHTIAPE